MQSDGTKTGDLKKNHNDILLPNSTPAGVVVNDQYGVVQLIGVTSDYLELTRENNRSNILELTGPGLAVEISNALARVKTDNQPFIKDGIWLPNKKTPITLEVVPLLHTDKLHYLVLFKTPPPLTGNRLTHTNGTGPQPDDINDAQNRIEQLEIELAAARISMQNMVEEHAVINEGLVSGNDELQRLYKELESGAEELQSCNEDLIIANEGLSALNEDLNQSRQFAEATIATLHEPLLILDKDFIIKGANKSFYKTFQLTDQETLGTILFDLQHNGWDIPGLRNHFKKILNGEANLIEADISFTFPAIGQRSIIFNIQPIHRQNGDPLILLAFNDITEIKNMVIFKEKGNVILKERQLLHHFFTHAPAILAILQGPQYVFEFANPGYMELIGNRNPVGKTVYEALPELEGQGFFELLNQVYNTGETFIGNEMPAFIDRGKNGPELLYLNFSYQAFKNEQDEIAGILVFANDVTEQVTARKKIEESEFRFRLALKESSQIVFSQDENLRYTWIYSSHPDFDAAAILGKDDYELHEPETAERLTALKKRVLNSGNAVHTEIPVKVNGKQEFYDVIVEPVINEEGKTEGITGVTINITESVNTRTNIEESGERLRLAVESTRLGIYELDIVNDHLIYSERITEIFGLVPSETLQYQDFKNALHPDDVPMRNKAYEIAMQTGNMFYEARVVWKDASVHWISLNGRVIFKNDAPFKMHGTILDITEEKNVTQILQENEERYTTIVNASNLGLWDYDAQTEKIIVAGKMAEIYGCLSNDTMVVQDLYDAIHPDDREIQAAHYKTLLSNTNQYSCEVELRIILKATSEIKWIKSTCKAFFNGDTVYRIVGTTQDTTAKKIAEKELNYRKALLEAQSEAFPDAILIVDTKGNMLSFNQHFIELWKIPEDIILRKDDTAALEFAMTQLTDPQGFIDRVTYCYAHPDEKVKDIVNFKDGRIIERYGNVVVGEDGTSYGWAWYFRDITGQSKAGEQIKLVKDQLELTFKNIPAGVYLINAAGEMMYVNERGAKAYGDFTPEEIIAEKNLQALLHRADELFERYDEKGNYFGPQNSPAYISLVTGQSSQAILRQINKTNKEERWHYVQGAPLFNDEGKVSMVLVTSTDITLQKNAEEKIRQSEAQLSNLANSIPQLAWMTDADGWIYWYNQRWYDYTGTTLEEMQGWGWQSVHHPDLVADVTHRFKNAIARGEPYEQTFLLRSKEGEYRWFLTRAIPIKNEEGIIVQWFGTNTDVTDQRNIEDALKESEARFRLLADSMPQQIWTGDAEGNLTYFNNAVYQFSGLLYNDIQRDGWMQIVHPDDRELNISRWHHSIKTGEDFFIEHRFKDHTGEYRWQLSRAIPQKNSEGKIQMWVGTSTDIHEQKNFATALEEMVKERTRLLHIQNETFNQAEEISCQGSYSLNLNTGELSFSDNLFRIIGYGPNEFKPSLEEFNKHVHPDDQEYVNQAAEKVFESKTADEWEYRMITKKGDVIYIKETGRVIRSGDEKILVGTLQDITTEKKAALDLIKMNSLLSNKNKELEQQILNDFSETFSAYKTGDDFFNSLTLDLAVKTGMDYVLIGELPEKKGKRFTIKTLALTAQGKLVPNIEYPLPDGPCEQVVRGKVYNYPQGCKISFPKNQTLIQFNIEGYVGYPLFDHEGNPIGLVAVMHQKEILDPEYISALLKIVAKRAEFEIERNKFGEARARAFMDSNVIGVNVSNIEDGVVLEANDAFLNMTGFSHADLKEGKINWKHYTPEEYTGRDHEAIETAMRKGVSLTYENEIICKDGRKIFVLAGRTLVNRDKKEMMTVFIDITERKKLEQQKEDFISIASHELKTPLTTAKAYLQLLELSLDKENETANLYARKAKGSVDRINDLIAELLDVSKIQYGKLNYKLAGFNFNEMVDGTVADLQHSSPKHSIIKTGSVMQDVYGDKDRLQQVVINLLSNAIKYSPDAGTVYMVVAQQDGVLKVSVRDEGIGMSKEHLDKIFERYYRVEDHAIQFQGLGIGLFISYEIIQRHHGKLWAESEPGKGSTFHFTLPLDPV